MFYTFLSVNTASVAKVCTGFIEVTVYAHMLLTECLRCCNKWSLFASTHVIMETIAKEMAPCASFAA